MIGERSAEIVHNGGSVRGYQSEFALSAAAE
jgi:hypothetical protein